MPGVALAHWGVAWLPLQGQLQQQGLQNHSCWVQCQQPQDQAEPQERHTRTCEGDVSAEVDAFSKMEVALSQNPGCTAVTLRNLPHSYTRKMLLEVLVREGFDGLFNFVYLPMDFKTKTCLGYAFVNLASESSVTSFGKKFSGYQDWRVPSRKCGRVTWSKQQCLQDHVERYQNSPIMSPMVPEEYKPLVFDEYGSRKEFPAPTKKLRGSQVKKLLRSIGRNDPCAQ